MADRGEVNTKEKEIAKLLQFYTDAYKQLSTEIIGATEAGQIRRAAVMREIHAILNQYGTDVADWVDSNIPQYYLDGAGIAAQDLKDLGINTKSGLNAVDRLSIEALVTDTKLGFADSITTLGRSSGNIVSGAIKQQLQLIVANGRLTGEARKTVTTTVVDMLKNEGITGLVDKSGRKWDLNTYAAMLVRTKAVEARNMGLANRMLANGFDLVQVSNHNSKHANCRKYEGKILSISGKTPAGTKLAGGYSVYGSLDDAKAGGLFHPNCKHSINVFNARLAAITEAYDNPYNYLSAEERAEADLAFKNRNKKTAQTTNVKVAVPKAVIPKTAKIANTEFKLNSAEGKFVSDKNITFDKGFKRGVYGYYRPAYRQVFVNNPESANAEATFYHELGHAIDDQAVAGKIISKSGLYEAIPKEQKREVVMRRVVIEQSYKGRTVTNQDPTEYIKTGRIITDKGSFSTQKAHLKYLTSSEEVLADAYSQYRLEPERFKQVAPDFYKLFEEVLK